VDPSCATSASGFGEKAVYLCAFAVRLRREGMATFLRPKRWPFWGGGRGDRSDPAFQVETASGAILNRLFLVRKCRGRFSCNCLERALFRAGADEENVVDVTYVPLTPTV
jgi:hypothetical protein